MKTDQMTNFQYKEDACTSAVKGPTAQELEFNYQTPPIDTQKNQSALKQYMLSSTLYDEEDDLKEHYKVQQRPMVAMIGREWDENEFEG